MGKNTVCLHTMYTTLHWKASFYRPPIRAKQAIRETVCRKLLVAAPVPSNAESEIRLDQSVEMTKRVVDRLPRSL